MEKSINSSFENENNEDNVSIFSKLFNKELEIENQQMKMIQENEENEENIDNKEITVLLENLKKSKTIEQSTTENTKRGRQKKNIANTDTHSKDAKDNKVRKIRIHAIKCGASLINDSIKNELQRKDLILRGICKPITSDISITFNNHFFNSTLAYIYSNPVNEKYKNCGKDENKKVIEKLLQLKHPIIDKLLNMKFFDFYKNIFLSTNKEDLIKEYGLKSAVIFQDFIDGLEKDTEEYKKDLKETAYNIKQYFVEDNARNSNRNKNKLDGTNFKDSHKKK